MNNTTFNLFNAVIGTPDTTDKSDIIRAIESLSDNDFRVFGYRVGLDIGSRPMSLSQVSVATGLSRQRCDQIENHAIGRLRKHFAESGVHLAECMDIRVTKKLIQVVNKQNGERIIIE